MNDTVRDTLKKLVAQYGVDLCANRQKLEGLLRDFCGQHRREVNVLVTAVREGVAEDIRKASGAQVDALLFHRLVRRLCDDAGIAEDNAQWAVRSWAYALGKTVPPPALVLVSTDGYANSFISEQEFLKVGPDYLRFIREEGFDATASHLEEWLREAAEQGSGDDITLGMICRRDIAAA